MIFRLGKVDFIHNGTSCTNRRKPRGGQKTREYLEVRFGWVDKKLDAILEYVEGLASVGVVVTQERLAKMNLVADDTA